MSGRGSWDKVIRSRIFWPRDAGATYRIGVAVFECLCCVCVADGGVLAFLEGYFEAVWIHLQKLLWRARRRESDREGEGERESKR